MGLPVEMMEAGGGATACEYICDVGGGNGCDGSGGGGGEDSGSGGCGEAGDARVVANNGMFGRGSATNSAKRVMTTHCNVAAQAKIERHRISNERPRGWHE